MIHWPARAGWRCCAAISVPPVRSSSNRPRRRTCSSIAAGRSSSARRKIWSDASIAPDLDVRPDDVLVLQNVGPVGGPGMPEWGSIAMPRKLLDAGVRDMVRIFDARMSGTASGTVVLHVCPEAAVGGPFALVPRRRRD